MHVNPRKISSKHGSQPITRRYVFHRVARTTRVYLAWYLQFRPYLHDSPYFLVPSHVQINAVQPNPTQFEKPRPSGGWGGEGDFSWKGRLCVLGPQSDPIRWQTEGRDRGCLYILLIPCLKGRRWMTFESSVSDL